MAHRRLARYSVETKHGAFVIECRSVGAAMHAARRFIGSFKVRTKQAYPQPRKNRDYPGQLAGVRVTFLDYVR